MSEMVLLNQEYRALIEEKQEENIQSAKAALEYILNSTARYHGRCVRSFSIPKLFTAKEVKAFETLLEELYGIFHKVIMHYYEDAHYRSLFGFAEELEELILMGSGYDCDIPIARIDIFLNEETRDFTFCEFNTDGSSAMNEDRELCRAVRRTRAFQDFEKKHRVSAFELFDSWTETFLAIYRSWQFGRKNALPRVAIVDFMENATENEFRIFREHFIQKGMECEICDIRSLTYEEGCLKTPDGMIVDAIYRRAVTSDIMKHIREIQPFLQAVKERAVCLIGGFQTQIVHNKRLYKILYSRETKDFLTRREQEFVKAHVPYTVSLEEDSFSLEEVLKNRQNWIIKPEDSYGSKGVFAGVEYEAAEWERHVRECMGKDYLLQAFHKPYETANIDLMTEKNPEFVNVSNLTGLFVYGGKLAGIYSRISKSEIISTQYSEMSLPSFLVEDKN